MSATRALTEFELWNRGGWPRTDVVGEKFHTDAIRMLFPQGLGSGSVDYQGTARLVPEPDNPHDPNAIGVRVEGQLIGYLAKEQAARYVTVISSLVRNGFAPTVPCQVWAYEYQDWQGTDRAGRDIYQKTLDARATIVLDEPHLCVPINVPPSPPHRVLPHGGALQVKGEEEHLDVLAPLVEAHGEAWVYATLSALTVGSGKSEKRVVHLMIDGETIGYLTPAMSAHFTPAIDHLRESSEVVAAKVLLKGNAIQVEAVLHAARGHQLDAAWLGTPTAATPPPSPAPHNTSLVAQTHGVAADAAAEPAGSQSFVLPPRPTSIVFNPAPGWPPPPDNWEPEPGWRPDPTWPAAPEGWPFWVAR